MGRLNPLEFYAWAEFDEMEREEYERRMKQPTPPIDEDEE